jgi:hypothetical protein
MHFGIAVALVVHLTNVDVRNRLPVAHHALLVFILIQATACAHAAPKSAGQPVPEDSATLDDS